MGDILLLETWKNAQNLSDNLANEFTSNRSGDDVVHEGIMLPMFGVENYPYTIIFNCSDDTPELLEEENRLQFRQSGYSLKVENNMLMLFTWRILEHFNTAKVNELIEFYKQTKRPMIEIENGWYSIEILGGETLQNGEYEPTYEFLIRKTDVQEALPIEENFRFKIESSAY